MAARLAVEAGAAGIIVSNHGARQLDYVPATIMALEEVLNHKLDTLGNNIQTKGNGLIINIEENC